MDYFGKLPLIMGLLGALLVGLLNYSFGSKMHDTIIKMAISLITFFFLGHYIKHCIERLIKENELKIEKEEQEQKDVIEEQKGIQSIPNIDYAVGEDEEFTPLELSEAIKDQIKR